VHNPNDKKPNQCLNKPKSKKTKTKGNYQKELSNREGKPIYEISNSITKGGHAKIDSSEKLQGVEAEVHFKWVQLWVLWYLELYLS